MNIEKQLADFGMIDPHPNPLPEREGNVKAR